MGGLQFIGNPKQPTFTICQLVNGVYQQQQYRLGDPISSYSISKFTTETRRLDAA